MASAVDAVEKKVNSDYTFDDVTEEMKTEDHVSEAVQWTHFLPSKPPFGVGETQQAGKRIRCLAVAVEGDATSYKSEEPCFANPTLKSSVR